MNQRFQNVILNLCILLNALLLFLTIFGTKMILPAGLQVVGRMHPMLLHFPIVLLLLACASEIFLATKQNTQLKEIADWLLLSAAFTAVIAAVLGLFLSKESGYNQEAITFHKWAGIILSLLSFVWYLLRNRSRKNKYINIATTIISAIAVFIASHQGATITHGKNFITAPLQADEEKKSTIALSDAIAYTHFIKPILELKCYGCHNNDKTKGGLNMETEALLLKGGKSGKLWDSTAANFGLMMQRIHMADDNKEHMPPIGKPQLTDEEKTAIFYWLKSGSSFTKKIMDYPETDSLRILAKTKFNVGETETYNFPAISGTTIKNLNTNYRLVHAIDAKATALEVNFYGASFYKGEQLKELNKVKDNIVNLNLTKMPVKDEDLKHVATFTNLRKLNLAFTAITGIGLKNLSPLKELKQLSLSGNSIKPNELDILKDLQKLQTVYIWNTGIKDNEVKLLQTKYPKINFETGFNGDTVIATLNAPIIEGEEELFANTNNITIKGIIKNAEARYTTDGSIPDSINSPIYSNGLVIDKTSTVKVKSFLPGWISSPVTEKTFYSLGVKIDSIELETKPNPQYTVKAGKSLNDRIKGDLNFRSKWLGYRETELKAFLYFNTPTKLSRITLSTLTDVASYIMPAQQIEIWGGNSKSKLKLLKTLTPSQPNKEALPSMSMNQLDFVPTELSVLKVVVRPITLPDWHPGKGEKGWIFFDEFFVQ